MHEEKQFSTFFPHTLSYLFTLSHMLQVTCCLTQAEKLPPVIRGSFLHRPQVVTFPRISSTVNIDVAICYFKSRCLCVEVASASLRGIGVPLPVAVGSRARRMESGCRKKMQEDTSVLFLSKFCDWNCKNMKFWGSLSCLASFSFSSLYKSQSWTIFCHVCNGAFHLHKILRKKYYVYGWFSATDSCQKGWNEWDTTGAYLLFTLGAAIFDCKLGVLCGCSDFPSWKFRPQGTFQLGIPTQNLEIPTWEKK